MKTTIYQIDAFTSKLFGGNPAAICPLDQWLSDDLMQKIGIENNLSETAFIIPDAQQSLSDGVAHYKIRWFTPAREIELCGHATLASAYVIFKYLNNDASAIEFDSMSGKLTITRNDDLITLDFPSLSATPTSLRSDLVEALGIAPVLLYNSQRSMAVFEHEEQILNMKPDFSKLAAIPDISGIAVTAPGTDCDFVSRFFIPKFGIDEDPVTGSAHCTLIPYWADRLGKSKLFARQLSSRRGEIWCESLGDRVKMSGKAVEYLRGEIDVE
jgi:PhzF family phenazine biosynthesis protein